MGTPLLYAGKAGSGYTEKMARELRKLMDPITVAKSPLSKKGGKKIDRWVEPKYWAEVDYRDITSDGLLRHVTFRGLSHGARPRRHRAPKTPRNCRRFMPAPGSEGYIVSAQTSALIGAESGFAAAT